MDASKIDIDNFDFEQPHNYAIINGVMMNRNLMGYRIQGLTSYSLARNGERYGHTIGFVVLTNNEAVIQEPSFNRNIYGLGVRATKQLTTNTGVVNASYQFKDKATVSFNTAGTGTLSISGAHAGGTEEFPFGVGALNATQKRTFICVAGATAQTASITGFIRQLSTSSNTLIGNGSTVFTTNFKVGDYISLANTDGNASQTVRVVAINGASSMVTNPSVNSTAAFFQLVSNSTVGSLAFKKFPTGYVFDLTANGTSGTTRTVSVSTTTSAAIDLKETFANSTNITVFFNNKREAAEPIGKTIRKSRFIRLDLSTHTNGINGPWSLGIADVHKLRNVYIGSTYSSLNRNVTNQFRIIKNSDDNLYKHSKLSLKENNSITLTTADRLVVELDLDDFVLE